MKIVHVCFTVDEAVGGGSISYVLDLSRIQLAQGHDVRIFAADQGSGRRAYGLTDAEVGRIPVTRVEVRPESVIRRVAPVLDADDPVMARVFRRWLTNVRPDVVHLHTPQYLSASVVRAADETGAPVVVSLHDGWWGCHQTFFIRAQDRKPCPGPGPLRCIACYERTGAWQTAARMVRNLVNVPLRRRRLKRISSRVAFFLAPSEFIRDQHRLAGLAADRLRVVPFGLPSFTTPTPRAPVGEGRNGPVRVGYVGGTRWRKGFDVLMAAGARLGPEDGIAIKVWGPSDPEEAAPASRARVPVALGGSYRRAEMATVLGGMDMMVVPSIAAESFSFAASEALAAGLPVLAARIGALPERLGPNVADWTFRPDDEEDLARALREAAGRVRSGTGWVPVPPPAPMPAHAALMDRIYVESGAAWRCPICAGDGRPWHEMTYESEKFWLIRCRSCGLIARHPQPGAEALRHLYGESYFGEGGMATEDPAVGYAASWEQWQAWHREDANEQLRLLERFIRPGRLLDVGCALGYFVKFAQERGWKAEGLDVSEYAVRYARDRLGVQADIGEIEQMVPVEGAYDAIVMVQTLEHLTDPWAALRVAQRALRPGGALLITTPNVESRQALRSPETCLPLTVPVHLFHFAPRTLRRTLDRAGLAVRYLDTGVSLFSVDTLRAVGFGRPERVRDFVNRHLRDVKDIARRAAGRLRGGPTLRAIAVRR